MISTVTTTTVTTVSTVALAGSLGLIVTLALILLLVQKELISSNSSGWVLMLRRTINVAIIPFAMSFGLIVLMKLAELIH